MLTERLRELYGLGVNEDIQSDIERFRKFMIANGFECGKHTKFFLDCTNSERQIDVTLFYDDESKKWQAGVIGHRHKGASFSYEEKSIDDIMKKMKRDYSAVFNRGINEDVPPVGHRVSMIVLDGRWFKSRARFNAAIKEFEHLKGHKVVDVSEDEDEGLEVWTLHNEESTTPDVVAAFSISDFKNEDAYWEFQKEMHRLPDNFIQFAHENTNNGITIHLTAIMD